MPLSPLRKPTPTFATPPVRPSGEEAPVPLVAQTLTTLVQELIQQTVAAQTAHKAASHTEQEVMLDVEMDGVRCLLVRTRPHPQAHSSLSPRELEIARMVAIGYPNKIIADVLDISEWTVGTHLRRIFAKLGVGARAAMVSRLIEEGVLCEYTGRLKSA